MRPGAWPQEIHQGKLTVHADAFAAGRSVVKHQASSRHYAHALPYPGR